MERRRLHLAGALISALALGSCGGGERQDADEPRGNFPVEVVSATFPGKQKLAKRTDLKIVVRNSGDKTIPNIAVTVRGFSERIKRRGLADPNRPVFVINGIPREIGTFPESKEDAPLGGDTAYVGTWALGKLAPGKQRVFKWNVTAVRPGPYEVSYRVAAGLDGKAKAVDENGDPLKGSFAGNITEEAPDSRVADDGRTILEDTPNRRR